MKNLKVSILCLMVLMLLSFVGCNQETRQIDWQLYGAWVSENGVESEKITISFSGKMPAKSCDDHSIHVAEAQIVFPQDFPYREDDEEVSIICHPGTDNLPSYFECNGFSVNNDTNRADKKTFYVFPDAELIVFQWGDTQNRYFAASTDPDADPAEILELYIKCVNANY